jgi:hypothetical protein
MSGRGCLWAIVKTVLMLSIFGGALSFAAFPWALPWPGRDRLEGSWIGALRSNNGPQAWLLLSLEPHRSYRVRLFTGAPVGGDAALCTANRQIDLFVSGHTTVWSGREFDVLLQPVQSRPPVLRLEILGTWDGRTVEFTQRNVSLADVLSASGYAGTEPESAKFISGQLRRASRAEFDAACGRLRR